MLEKRGLLKLVAAAVLVAAFQPLALRPAHAKDGGGDGGGHDNSGHGGGDDGGGDDNGGDNRGRGNDDDARHDARGLDQDEALSERRKGRIIPLKKALRIVRSEVPGKIIDIRLTNGLAGAQYRIKIRRQTGEITTIRLDARTGDFVGILGF